MIGMVISGQYFGWNAGIVESTRLSFFFAVIVIVVFYVAFLFGCSAISQAYMSKGKSLPHIVGDILGEKTKHLMGAFCFLEYWFATPAIAIVSGVCITTIVPAISFHEGIILCFIFIYLANIVTVKNIATIEMFITAIALIGIILLYIFFISKELHTPIHNLNLWYTFNIVGLNKSIPFAVWFFLGAEGCIVLVHYMKKPRIEGSIALLSGCFIIAVLAVVTASVFIIAAPKTIYSSALPLYAFSKSFGNSFSSFLILVFGFFGLVASLNGLTIGYIQQYQILKNTSIKKKELFIFILSAGVISLSNNVANSLIILSVSAAFMVYSITWLSVIVYAIKTKRRLMMVLYIIFFSLLLYIFYCVVRYAVLISSLKVFDFSIPLSYLVCSLVIVVFLWAFVIVPINHKSKIALNIE